MLNNELKETTTLLPELSKRNELKNSNKTKNSKQRSAFNNQLLTKQLKNDNNQHNQMRSKKMNSKQLKMNNLDDDQLADSKLANKLTAQNQLAISDSKTINQETDNESVQLLDEYSSESDSVEELRYDNNKEVGKKSEEDKSSQNTLLIELNSSSSSSNSNLSTINNQNELNNEDRNQENEDNFTFSTALNYNLLDNLPTTTAQLDSSSAYFQNSNSELQNSQFQNNNQNYSSSNSHHNHQNINQQQNANQQQPFLSLYHQNELGILGLNDSISLRRNQINSEQASHHFLHARQATRQRPNQLRSFQRPNRFDRCLGAFDRNHLLREAPNNSNYTMNNLAGNRIYRHNPHHSQQQHPTNYFPNNNNNNNNNSLRNSHLNYNIANTFTPQQQHQQQPINLNQRYYSNPPPIPFIPPIYQLPPNNHHQNAFDLSTNNNRRSATNTSTTMPANLPHAHRPFNVPVQINLINNQNSQTINQINYSNHSPNNSNQFLLPTMQAPIIHHPPHILPVQSQSHRPTSNLQTASSISGVEQRPSHIIHHMANNQNNISNHHNPIHFLPLSPLPHRPHLATPINTPSNNFHEYLQAPPIPFDYSSYINPNLLQNNFRPQNSQSNHLLNAFNYMVCF